MLAIQKITHYHQELLEALQKQHVNLEPKKEINVMKKSLSQAIALATLLGAAVTANATPATPGAGVPGTPYLPTDLVVSEEAVGSALVFPLYTVDNNNSTLLSITNTTGDFKAVKVRFLEGLNSAEVLDFHLYLSPKDVWSGSIVATAKGAKLLSNDTSCIVGLSSGFPKEGLEFRTTEIVKDGEVGLVERTRVGHFEVIEMGVVDPAEIISGTITAQKAIEHVNGKPGNCAAVTAAWNPGGKWYTDIGGAVTVNAILKNPNAPVATDVTNPAAVNPVTAPTGGLYGTSAIVNVQDSWAVTYDATALKNIYTNQQHTYPGTIFPHLLSGVDPLIGSNGYATPLAIASNDVTMSLNKTKLFNDYYVDPALAAQTDFVITFPTKRFHVNAKHTDGTALPFVAGGTYTKAVGDGASTAQLAPFAEAWNGKTAQSCDAITISYFNKEEGENTVALEHISPLPTTPGSSLCYETNIFGMNDSNVFGGSLNRKNFALNDKFTEGWMELTLGTTGLPVVGFSAITTKNGVSADGVIKNFGQSFAHKYTK